MCIIYILYNLILLPVQKEPAWYFLPPTYSQCHCITPQKPFGSKADPTLVSG